MTRRLARPTLAAYEKGVRDADRAVLAQALTLVESRRPEDADLAQALLVRLLPFTGRSRRVGITGIPGVGKSTFIDELGMRLVRRGFRPAVLAIDPSSSLSGGSILGDKTRMTRLSVEPAAFIRPTPSGLTPGGVARRTRESLLLCEAAGFDVVLVETVGVGQGEAAVADLVDFLLVLALPGAGDELQGIKKGVLELADAIAVNKADGDNQIRVQLTLAELKAAFKYLPRKRPTWVTRALAVSGLTGAGLDDLWAVVEQHRTMMEASGELLAQRAQQQRRWMWSLIGERLEQAFRDHPDVAAVLAATEAEVVGGRQSPTAAADALLRAFGVTRRE